VIVCPLTIDLTDEPNSNKVKKQAQPTDNDLIDLNSSAYIPLIQGGVNKVKNKSISIWKDFLSFIGKGNVIDLAIGIVIGTAFSTVINSLVNDLILPPFGLLAGSNFENWFIVLKHGHNFTQHYNTLKEAQDDGAVTENFGRFINLVLNFFIISMCLFIIIRGVQKIHRKVTKPKKRRRSTTKRRLQVLF